LIKKERIGRNLNLVEKIKGILLIDDAVRKDENGYFIGGEDY